MKRWGVSVWFVVCLLTALLGALEACSSDNDHATAGSSDASAPVDTGAASANPSGSGATAVGSIGIAGGSVSAGKATIDVGAGDLPSTTSISVTESAQPAPATYRAASPVYQFGPEGLLFSAPITVHIQYSGPTAGFAMFYSRLDDPTKYDSVATTFGNGEATAQATHFLSAFLAALPDDDGGAQSCLATVCPAASAQGQACTTCTSACSYATQLCMCQGDAFSCFDIPSPPDAGTAPSPPDAGALPTTSLPTASTPSGNYMTALDVTLSDGTAGATIYYTTDGSDPSTASTVYPTSRST